MGAFDVSIRIGAPLRCVASPRQPRQKGRGPRARFSNVGQGLSGVFDPLFSALMAAATAMAAAGGRPMPRRKR
jgi:hypothetical protein